MTCSWPCPLQPITFVSPLFVIAYEYYTERCCSLREMDICRQIVILQVDSKNRVRQQLGCTAESAKDHNSQHPTQDFHVSKFFVSASHCDHHTPLCRPQCGPPGMGSTSPMPVERSTSTQTLPGPFWTASPCSGKPCLAPPSLSASSMPWPGNLRCAAKV